MPLQPAEPPLPAHRQKESFDAFYLRNPFTDDSRFVEQAYQLFAELSRPRIAAAVARPVPKAEAAVNQDARKALQTGWDRLRSIGSWGESGAMGRNEVVRQRTGQTVLFGRLFAILVEKNSELPSGSNDRKHNGRVVFEGGVSELRTET
eukprot:2761930-Pyramimonas_sp.AAC.1